MFNVMHDNRIKSGSGCHPDALVPKLSHHLRKVADIHILQHVSGRDVAYSLDSNALTDFMCSVSGHGKSSFTKVIVLLCQLLFLSIRIKG